MIRLNFVGSGTFLDTKDILGNWANLIWDAIGIAIYMLVSCTLFLGMRLLKRYLNASSYIKWGSTGLLIRLLALLVKKLQIFVKKILIEKYNFN
ncbi:hypothetical protein D6D54_07290 [Spiroplasma poulsonii]|uniref:Uncharacterized protein n=1 Tax=Spiroplasma poulsonii TaxID=2138 RepID=A0A3S0SDA6_9MOLU|nr:hypothetical protein [Spiroplasma poulsonii]MBW3058828.1 hypothetical protein [Spiroplasma poulsonii]RUP75962.1 hypothetical protein D6D54_07290 [Spiroplasma poulsonii]